METMKRLGLINYEGDCLYAIKDDYGITIKDQYGVEIQKVSVEELKTAFLSNDATKETLWQVQKKGTATGGRRSKNQRKSRRSRKQRNQRKSRRSRR